MEPFYHTQSFSRHSLLVFPVLLSRNSVSKRSKILGVLRNYPEGIWKTIQCAGALCARSNFIGACLGAMYGIENIPIEWIERVEGME